MTFDLEAGNLLKATRFGYVVRASHGTRMLPFEEQRRQYTETIVELSEPRFKFMNTLFELSRASLWCQLVDAHDRSPIRGVSGYADLYRVVDQALADTHLDGALKGEILADPDRFIDPDPDVVQTLIDQRSSGKNLLLITNSDWAYTQRMMAHTVDPYCPPRLVVEGSVRHRDRVGQQTTVLSGQQPDLQGGRRGALVAAPLTAACWNRARSTSAATH